MTKAAQFGNMVRVDKIQKMLDHSTVGGVSKKKTPFGIIFGGANFVKIFDQAQKNYRKPVDYSF